MIDSLTKVLVALYEEPEKPQAAIDFLKSSLGSPTPAEYDALMNEKTLLEEKCAAMEAKVDELTKKVGRTQTHTRARACTHRDAGPHAVCGLGCAHIETIQTWRKRERLTPGRTTTHTTQLEEAAAKEAGAEGEAAEEGEAAAAE